MDDFVSWFYSPRKEFDSGNIVGFVFKVMNFAEIPLFDDFFPLADTQTPQLPNHCSDAYRVLEDATSD